MKAQDFAGLCYLVKPLSEKNLAVKPKQNKNPPTTYAGILEHS